MADIQRSFRHYEKKFLLTPDEFHALLPSLCARMQTDAYGLHTVCNIYYDTDSYEIIRASMEGPVYKEKFRIRSYGVPTDRDDVYAEIKKKVAGVVCKRRIEAHPNELLEFLKGERNLPYGRQIQNEIRWLFQSRDLKPCVFIGYDRFSLLKEDEELRITFDRNMRWRKENLDLRLGDHGEHILGEDRIVMEVKTTQALPLWLAALLSEEQIYSVSFSKYASCYQNHILREYFI